MNKPTEAETLQISAIVVAAPRYMGAFASAIGVDVLAYWPAFTKIEIGSGAAMAILEGWAVAFMFRKWRTMQPFSPHWWVLLLLQLLLMLALPATAAPYLASSQLGEPVNALLPFALWWIWNFTVAAIAPLVLAAVGYADVEVQKEPARNRQESKSKPAQSNVEQPQATHEPAIEPIVCVECKKGFDTVQGLNAHKRFCKGEVLVQSELVHRNGASK